MLFALGIEFVFSEIYITELFLFSFSIIIKDVFLYSRFEKKARLISVRLRLQGAIYRPDSFAVMLRYCANLKAIRYESTSLNRIVADKSHRVIVA